MTRGADRRSVLTGLAALGAAGCGPAPAVDEHQPGQEWPLDLSALEQRHGGRIGLCAANTDRVWWRGLERFNYCSTFKLFLAAATLERVRKGEERLDRAIAVTAADMINHAPVTRPAVGSTLTIEQLCKGTVEVSDNPAANILIRELGGLDALRVWYRSIGDTDTTVDRLEPMLNRRDGDKDSITPAQAVANLDRILFGDAPLLVGAQHDLLLGWLKASPTGPGRIKAGAPAGWSVAHKTGTGGTGQTNDIGVLYPPTGQVVGIAVYYDAPSTLADATRDAVIAEATRLALAALDRVAAE